MMKVVSKHEDHIRDKNILVACYKGVMASSEEHFSVKEHTSDNLNKPSSTIGIDPKIPRIRGNHI